MMIKDSKRRNLIQKIVDKIVKNYKPNRIILYGSYAWGMPDEDSDIDLMIIKNTRKDPLERWMYLKRLLREFSRDYPISPLVYTEKELEKRISLRDFLRRQEGMFIEYVLCQYSFLLNPNDYSRGSSQERSTKWFITRIQSPPCRKNGAESILHSDR